MKIQLEYIIDSKGKRKFVILPLKQLEIINKDFAKGKNKIQILKGLVNAVGEIKQIQNGRKKGQTLKQVLAKL